MTNFVVLDICLEDCGRKELNNADTQMPRLLEPQLSQKIALCSLAN